MEQRNQFTEEQSSTAEANDETITQAPNDSDNVANNANDIQEASRCTETTDDSGTATLNEAQQVSVGTGRTRTRRTRRNQTEAEEATKAQIRASRAVASTSIWLDNVDRQPATTEVSTDSQEPPSGTGRRETRRTRRNQTEAEEPMQSQMRETRNAHQTTASASLEPDSGAHVGDKIDTHTIASRYVADEAIKAQIRASRNAASATTVASDSLVPSPDLESGVPVSSVAVATSAISKTRPEPLADRERPGVTYVQSRAVGSMPAWSNWNSSPHTHEVANYVPPEMRVLSDVDDQPAVVRHETPMVSRNLASNVEQVDTDLPIIAELAPDEAEMEARVTARLKAEMVERLEQQLSEHIRRAAATIVVAEAVAEPEEVEKEARLCGLSRNFCYLLFSAVVVAVGVAVGGAVRMNKTIPDTLAPTVYTTERFQMLLDLIGPTVTSNIKLFQDQQTPQYAALEWLADIDEWNTDIDFDSLSPQVLVERYVLALLYLSTNDNFWSREFNFLQNTSVCEWSSMELEGVICDDPYVTELNLRDVSIQGTIPSELALLASVTKMDFRENNFFGSIPIELYSMTNLEFLGFSDNELSGSIPTEIAGMLNLHSLHLDGNAINGTLPTELGLLSNLDYLYLRWNDLDGTVPIEICFLTSLEELKLWHNNLRGTIPTEMGQLTKLSCLDFSENSLSGTIPTEIGHMLRLEFLYLHTNDIGGSLPTEVGLLPDLRELWCQRNRLNETIPSAIGFLTNLESIILEGNILTGNLPTEIGLLTQLKILHLDENELAGSLPTELGLLSKLRDLNLHLNDMAGSLPSEIGLLTALEKLNLAHNKFASQVPLEYSTLTALEAVYLEDNDLTGSLNGVFCGGLPIEVLWSDCSGDPPEISCPCCTRCCMLQSEEHGSIVQNC